MEAAAAAAELEVGWAAAESGKVAAMAALVAWNSKSASEIT